MSLRRIMTCLLIAFAVALAPFVGAAAAKKEPEFGAVVKLLETHYGVKHRGIPTLARMGIATAKTTAKIISPTARRYLRLGDFKLAIFEDEDFSAGAVALHRRLRETLAPDWQPLVVVLTQDEAQTFTFTKADGDKFKVLVVFIEQRDAVVVQVDLKPQEFFKLLRDPENESRAIADEAATAEPENNL